MFRQGDVLIIPLAGHAPPAHAKPLAREGGRVVLAHGEVTGHAHAIGSPRAALFRDDGSNGGSNGRTLLQVIGADAVQLSHEEHGTIALDPGLYEVRRQREYSPEEIRNVAD